MKGIFEGVVIGTGEDKNQDTGEVSTVTKVAVADGHSDIIVRVRGNGIPQGIDVFLLADYVKTPKGTWMFDAAMVERSEGLSDLVGVQQPISSRR